MLAKDEPKIIEYNARFGDPEAMNVLPILKTPLPEIAEGGIVGGRLKKAEFEKKATVVKYLAPPGGYPADPIKGVGVEIREDKIREEGARVYYASVDENLTLLGSRAVAVVGIAGSLEEAERIASAGIRHVRGGEVFHRADVGGRGRASRRGYAF